MNTVINRSGSSSNYSDGKMFIEPQVQQYGSHMVMTNVMKPTRTKYINVDTRFTDDYVTSGAVAPGGVSTGGACRRGFNYGGTAAHGYTLTLPERVNEVKSIRINAAEIPISFYTISATLGNSFFRVTDQSTGSGQMVIVPDGTYATAIDLLTALRAPLQAATGNHMNIQIDALDNATNFVYLTASTGTSYTVDFNTDIQGNADKYLVRSKLGWLLGYRDTSVVVTSANRSLAVSAPNLQPMRYLYVVVDEYNNNFQNSFLAPMGSYVMNKKILARISVDGKTYPYGMLMVANESNGFLVTDTRTYNGKVDLQRLNVQLVTEWGVPIDLRGLDFSFILEVTYEN